jgi:hypothetical protein
MKTSTAVILAVTFACLVALVASQSSCLRGSFTCQNCNGQLAAFPVASGTEVWTSNSFVATYNLASSAQCSTIVISGGYTTTAVSATAFNVSLSGASACAGSGSTTAGCTAVCGGLTAAAQAGTLDQLNFNSGCSSTPSTYTDRYGFQWRGAASGVQASFVLVAVLGLILLAF